MKLISLITGIIVCSNLLFGQKTFVSSKYGYSFVIPPQWSIKDKIITPSVDAKIVDGKGNSIVVSVNPLPDELKHMTAKEILSSASDEDLKQQFCAAYDECSITKRGIMYIDGKEFYYIHISEPFEDGLRLIHKMFMYHYKSNAYSIDCAAISSMSSSVAPYFDLALNSFKFNK